MSSLTSDGAVPSAGRGPQSERHPDSPPLDTEDVYGDEEEEDTPHVSAEEHHEEESEHSEEDTDADQYEDDAEAEAALVAAERGEPAPEALEPIAAPTAGEDTPQQAESEAEAEKTASQAISPPDANPETATGAAAAVMDDDQEAGPASGAATGMRRDWNFSLTVAHKQARVVLQCSPQWEPTFIDPDLIDQVRQLDRDVRHTPLIPYLRYTDFSAVVGGATGRGRGNGGGRLSSVSHLPGDGHDLHDESGANKSESGDLAGRFHDAYDDVGGDWWLEKAKHVEMLYSHVPPGITLERFCKDCVHHVLKDPQIVAIDHETDRTHVHVGQKLDCPHRLGGYRSFHFRCRLQNRSQLIDDSVYAIGTIARQRGYLVLIRCSEEGELEGYLSRLFLPAFASNKGPLTAPVASATTATPTNTTATSAPTTTLKLQLDVDVQYHDVASPALAEQQERYGELRYVDRDACISFTLPMHPMRMRPDFSPAKTVGVGSIACMTIEVNVYERLIDDVAVAELSGMPRFKANQIVLCLDVEDVARMAYPRVISIEEYSRLKTERLMDVFTDARSVGQPTTVPVGGRVGRCRTTTFTYEPLQGLVKDMSVSTLVDNRGVTVLYLTRLGGGVFDTHLYLFQQLLASIEYHAVSGGAAESRAPLATATTLNGVRTANHTAASPTRTTALDGAIKDRHHIPNTRLLEPDLPRAYAKGVAAAAAAASHEAERATARGFLIEGTPASPTASASAASSPVSSHGAPLNTALSPEVREMLEQHIAMLRQSNDGRVEGPTIVVTVPLEEGGATGEEGGRGVQRPSVDIRADLHGDTDTLAVEDNEGSAGPTHSDRDEADATKDVASDTDTEGEASLLRHSLSLISVSSIPHLGTTDDVDAPQNPSAPQTSVAATTTARRGTGGGADADPFADVTPLQVPQKGDASARAGASVTRPVSDRAKQVSVIPIEEGEEDDEDGDEAGVGAARGAGDSRASNSSLSRGAVTSHDSGTHSSHPSASLSLDAEDGHGVAVDAKHTTAENEAAQMALKAAQEAIIREALDDSRGENIFHGSSLRDVYTRCCELQQCRPNSYLLRKLPTDAHLTASIEELDLTSNYLGHNGVVAVLSLLTYLPHLRSVYFVDMSLDNTDVEHISKTLLHHPSVEVVHLDNNPRITLPATRDLTKLVRGNHRLKTLSLSGTKLGELVIQRLEKELEERQTLMRIVST